MPGLINGQIEFSVSNGAFARSAKFPPSSPFQITQTSEGGGSPGFLTIGTAEEDISFGDVVPGFVLLFNLSPDRTIEYGPKNGSNVIQNFLQISPGSAAMFELKSGTVLRMKAIGAAANLVIEGFNV